MKKKRIQALALALAMSFTAIQPLPSVQVKSVQAATVKKPVLNKTKVTIKVGMKTTLKLKNAKAKKVKWKSSNKKIATVKKGVVTGNKPGNVKITATYKGKKYKAKIKVKDISKKLKTTLKTVNQGVNMLDYADAGKNIVLSPLSLNMALSMALNGASKEAGKELKKYLGDSTEEINSSALRLMKLSEKRDSLNISNSVWYKEGFEIKDSFYNIIESNYKADCYKSKFDQSTVDEMNSWVDKKTDGMIKKIVEQLKSDTCAVLINALLFKGAWDVEFHDAVKKDFFDFSGKKKKVDTISGDGCIYYENDKATGFEKTYENGQYSFIAVLPKKEGKFAVKDLDLAGFLRTRTTKYDVYMEMPKFSYDWDSGDSEKNIPNYLSREGVNAIFNPTINPLGNMLEVDESGSIPEGNVGFYVSDIIQKCRIEVDEKGTKAAAVTAVMANATTCLPEPDVRPRKEVILNRPFAYLIVDNTTGQTLFMGKVTSIDK